MKLNKYIYQLLLDNEMVIIPGFGEFISEYQPAEIDDATAEIKPPSTQLVFNPQIRNNDGLLVGYVAEQTRSSHFEALQKIEKERDNIVYQLDKGEKVELEDIGTLFYNTDNQIEFISETEQNLSHESFGLEAMSLKESEPIEKVEDVVEKDEPAKTEEPVVVEKSAEKDEQETEEPEPWETKEEFAVPPVIEEPEEKENIEQEEAPVEEPKPALTDKTDEPQKEKKRKSGWIWLFVVLIPLVAVSVFLLMKDKPTNTPVNDHKQPSTPEIKEEPVVAIDTTAKDSTAILPQKDSVISNEVSEEQTTTVESSGPKFYLVGGSFKEEENAETYIQVLKEKGFEPFKMGKYGNFYILGIGTYDTEEEAVSAKREFLEKSPDSGIWILEK